MAFLGWANMQTPSTGGGTSAAGHSGGAPVLLIVSGLGALLATAATAASHDPLFQFQGYIFMIAFILAAAALTIGLSSGAFSQDKSRYSDGVIKAGVIASLFWGVVGMLVGCADRRSADLAQRSSTSRTMGFLNFGRIRPLHTSAVIFAFGGNALIATSF